MAAEKRLKYWLPVKLDTPIIDLACGNGNLLHLLERRGYTDITGVDIGADQLSLARQAAPTANLVQEDLFGFLANRTRQYGFISCLNIIEHFTKQELFPFLDLVVDALQPGGRVVFETPNAESPWFGAVAYADLTHEWFFTPRGLGDAVALMNLERYEARASRPEVIGFKSLVRSVLWRGICRGLELWNLAETGSAGSRIYSRVFVATALKPSDSAP